MQNSSAKPNAPSRRPKCMRWLLKIESWKLQFVAKKCLLGNLGQTSSSTHIKERYHIPPPQTPEPTQPTPPIQCTCTWPRHIMLSHAPPTKKKKSFNRDENRASDVKKKLLPKNQQPCHAICVPQKENGDPSTREWAPKIKSMAHVCDSDQKHAQIIVISWRGPLVHARNSIKQSKKSSRLMVALWGHGTFQ